MKLYSNYIVGLIEILFLITFFFISRMDSLERNEYFLNETNATKYF